MVSGSIITTEGKKIFLDRTYNSVPTRTVIENFKVGSGTSTPALSDTDLESAVPFGPTDTVDDCGATTGWVGSTDVTLSLNTTTYKQGTASLNIEKSGTSSTIASADKTSSLPLDFTGNQLSLWVYIIDEPTLAYLTATDAIEIRYGSDNSN